MKLVVIKGAGDIATGIAVRLHNAGFAVAMTEIEKPTAIRRTVSISRAIYEKTAEVEGMRAEFAKDALHAAELLENGLVPLLCDPKAECVGALAPLALVDAILAKKNTGTNITDCKIVVGVGPGFTAGQDCHAAVETMRGHHLGRVYYSGSPIANTGVPGEIGGFGKERVMHAPASGSYRQIKQIGDFVSAGEAVACVGELPVTAKIDGVLRGTLPEGIEVFCGMKCADVDPRAERSHCFSISDKARSVGGGVLEAVLHFMYIGDRG